MCLKENKVVSSAFYKLENSKITNTDKYQITSIEEYNIKYQESEKRRVIIEVMRDYNFLNCSKSVK